MEVQLQTFQWKKTLTIFILFALFSNVALAQQRKITGIVTQQSDHKPLPGVVVKVKGTKKAVSTDTDGKYVIGVEGSENTLLFSFIGFVPQELALTADVQNVELAAEDNRLNEIVVVAYGTANKATYTGSAAVVSAKDLENRQVSNVSRSLQGLVPGLQSVAPAGQPGSEATIRLRGIGSVNASSSPLYVVDGIPFSGNINSISNSEIQSISVLKDAAASALYGSRGANGVIIITTKQGQFNSKATVTINANTGISTRAYKDYNYLDNKDYFELYWEALRNTQLDQGKTAAQAAQYASTELVGALKINPFGAAYPQPVGLDGKLLAGANSLWNDDWTKSLSRNGIRNQLELGISGGSENSKYYVAGGYLNDKGFIVGSGFTRYNARVNYNTKVNKWFEAGLNIAATSTSQDAPPQTDSNQGNFANFGRLVANIYPVYERNADGSYKLDAEGNKIYDFGNYRPSAAATGNNLLGGVALNKYNNKQDALIFRGNFQFNLLKGLKLKNSVNTDYVSRLNHSYTNPGFGSGLAGKGSVSKSSSRTVGTTINNLLDYTFDLADQHHFNLLAGQELYLLSSSNLSGSRSNFGFQGKDEPAAASLLNSFTGDSDEYKLSSFLGKTEYNFAQKYYLTASFRRDGSSRFSQSSRWGNFWSLGASWNLSSESFLKASKWINNLSLRTSYGAQGNDNLGSYYAYQDLYSIYNSLGEAGLVTSRLPTPGLKWETNLNFNAGVDFALFNNRLTGTFEVYQRKSKDLLFSRPLSPSLGFTAIDDNIGSLRNNGFEGQINYVPIRTTDLTWDFGVNFGHFSNQISALPQKEIISGNVGQLGSTKKLVVGGSVYDFFIREWAGVDPLNGKPLWYKNTFTTDGAGIKTITGRTTTSVYADADQYFQGSALPDLYGGVSSRLKYKGIELSFLVSYSIGGKILDLDKVMISHNGDNPGRTWSDELLNRWTPQNTQTDVPRLSTQATNWNSISTRFLYDASYARLKNLTLGYSLPNQLASAIGFKNIKLSVSGENLITLFGQAGLDPEQAVDGVTFYRYPAQKTIAFGLNASF